MAAKYSDVIASPEFQALDREAKIRVSERYFEKVVSPEIQGKSAEEMGAIRKRFDVAMNNAIGSPSATEIRPTTPSEKFAGVAEEIAPFAGAFAKKTPMGMGLSIGATTGTEAIRQGIQKFGGEEKGQNIPMWDRLKMLGKAAMRGATTEGIGRGLGVVAEPVFKGISEVPGAKAIGEFVENIPEKTSARMVNSLIKPKSKAFLYGKNPGKGVVDEGIVAFSLEDLAKKVSAKKQEIGKMYEPLLEQNKDKVLDLSKVLKPIDDAIESVGNYSRTNKEVITRLEDTRMDLIENIVKRDKTGSWGINPSDALKLKQEIGNITKFTGRESDDKAVNSALQDIYRNIDKELDIAIPEMKAVNERWANMLGAEVSAKERAALLERQNMLHLPEIIVGTGGSALGLASGEPSNAAVWGLGAGAVTKSLGTPIAKTLGAQIVGRGVPWAAEVGAKKILPRAIGQSQANKYFPSEELLRKKYQEQK